MKKISLICSLTFCLLVFPDLIRSQNLTSISQGYDAIGACASVDHNHQKNGHFLQKIGAVANMDANVRFPVSGTVNALVIFAQHKDDAFRDCRRFDGWDANQLPTYTDVASQYNTFCANRSGFLWTPGNYQSYTDDPVSEWPAALPSGPNANTRQLPNWANNIIDPPGSTTFTAGSLSELYHQASNGALTLTGEVWPYTYIPDHNKSHYNMSANYTPYANGVSRLSQEIISYVDSNPYGLDLTAPIWDQYTNGQGNNFTPDGRFDMIIIIYRFSELSTISLGSSQPIPANNVATLGVFNFSSGINGFASEPVTLGGYEVVDNFYNGSGVLQNAITLKGAVRIVAHEIGHRQFGTYHTDVGNGSSTDHTSVMNGSAHLAFNAGDKIKAGWANIQEEDITTIGVSKTITLRDAYAVNSTEADVVRIRSGASNQCGDVIIEARVGNQFLERRPGIGGNLDDGDGGDYHLPQSGLLVSKYPGSTCGFAADGTRNYSGMPNGGDIPRRKFFGVDQWHPNGPYRLGFGEGDAYTPFSEMPNAFHTRSAIDDHIAITDISISGDQVTFTLWSDWPTANATKTLETNYDFDSETVARNTSNTWQIGGTLELDGTANVGNQTLEFGSGAKLAIVGDVDASGTTFTGQSSGTWGGIQYRYGSESHFDNVTVDNVFVGYGGTALTVDYGVNSFILSNSTIFNDDGGIADAISVRGGSGTREIYNNHIVSTRGSGLVATNYSNVYARNNDFEISGSTSYSGIRAIGGSDVTTSLPSQGLTDGENEFMGNGYAIYASGFGSFVSAGESSGTAASNQICSTGATYMVANSSAIINAYHNAWPGSPLSKLSTSGGGVININLYAWPTSTCNPAFPVAFTDIESGESAKSSTRTSLEALFADARDSLAKGHHQAASDLLKRIMLEYPSSKYAQAALVSMLHIYGDTRSKGLLSYIESNFGNSHPLHATALSVLQHAAFSDGEIDQANALGNEIMELYPKTEQAFRAALGIFYLKYSAQDYEGAINALRLAVPTNDGETYELAMARWLLKEQVGSEVAEQISITQSPLVGASDADAESTSNAEVDAYPNPFNPTTIIQYSVSERANVVLKIYDVSGREIAELANGFKNAGLHSAVFEASHLASGLYLYRLQVGNQVVNGRLMLVK